MKALYCDSSPTTSNCDDPNKLPLRPAPPRVTVPFNASATVVVATVDSVGVDVRVVEVGVAVGLSISKMLVSVVVNDDPVDGTLVSAVIVGCSCSVVL
jgi:hypothetical protein